MVYEVVPGARLVGEATPGATVEVTLPVRSRERPEPLLWRARAPVRAAGRYRVPVPYANDGGEGPVRAGPRYRLRCGTAEGTVRVPEQAVQRGAAVAGPRLACGGAAAPG